MGWLQTQDQVSSLPGDPLIQILFFHTQQSLNQFKPNGLIMKTILSGRWYKVKTALEGTSESLQVRYVVATGNIRLLRHRRGQLVRAGWDVPEPPAMLVSHYIGLSFFETQPTGWSINTINCVALQCRLCWLTGAYMGAGGWQVMKLVSANRFICKL